MKVGIIGVGKYLPSHVLTNYDLEKMVETSDEWITTRSGIKERHLVSDNQASSDLAINASRIALERANIKPEDLDLIIVATITPDMQFPSTACFVQIGLGAKNACCFDISAACAGFVYAMSIAQQFISQGTYKNALIVGAETLSSITDWQDRNTCVLFGDGAGAAVLAPQDDDSKGILSTYLASDGNLWELLNLPGGGSRHPASQETLEKRMHYVKMRGNELFKLAVRSMTEAVQKALDKAGLDCKDVDWIVPHQANIRILLSVAKKLGISPEKIYLNIEKYGNMSSASTAVALCEAVETNSIKKGDIVVLDAFGGGLVWAACVIRW